VLKWVAHGCPDGVWTDFTYKTVAYGLARRGLVSVQRRRNSWRAAVTEQGTHYLQHGTYAPTVSVDQRQPREADEARSSGTSGPSTTTT